MNKLIFYSNLFHNYAQAAKKNVYTNYTACFGKSNTSVSITKQVLFTESLIEGRRGSRINGKHLISPEYIFSRYFILDTLYFSLYFKIYIASLHFYKNTKEQ